MSIDWAGLEKLGFSFFPAHKNGKHPLIPKWNDLKSRKPTPDEVREWSKRDSNVAIVTGAISGIVVLDVDSDEGERLVQAKGIPDTPVVETAKGRHYYFKHPGFEVRNFAGRIEGCDLRGDGGYVIGPESVHETGAVYTTKIDFDRPLAPMPQWLIDLTSKPEKSTPPVQSSKTPWAEKALDSELASLRRATEGNRNDALNRAAFNLGQIVGGGSLDYAEVERHLASTALNIGLTTNEIQKTLASGLDGGMKEPRRPPETLQRARTSTAGASRKSNVVPIAEFRQAEDVRHDPVTPLDPIHWQDKRAPDRPWLMKDWIPDRTVTLLYGEGGTGKSLLAQQLATTVALGKPFAGIDIPRRRVLAVFCEDDADELQRRQEAINARLDCDHADLEDLRYFSRPGADNIMMTFNPDGTGSPTELFAEIRAAALEFGAGLIIWDTISDGFAGNENIRPQVRQFMSLFTRLALDINGAVLMCAHPSVSGRSTGEAGSTQWSNSSRSRLFLERPDDDGADPVERRLSRKKANYATAEDVIDLFWNNGAFIVKDKPEGIIASITRDKAERVFLEALQKLNVMGEHASSSNKSTVYAPKMIHDRRLAQGVKRGVLHTAMVRLLNDGKIRVETVDRRKCLVEVKT